MMNSSNTKKFRSLEEKHFFLIDDSAQDYNYYFYKKMLNN